MVVASGDRIGEGLWKTPAVPLHGPAPWAGLRHFRTVSLGPASVGRPPALLILGGRLGNEYRNDVWCSKDGGVSWDIVSPHEGRQTSDGRAVWRKWPGREGHAAAGAWKIDGGGLSSVVYVVGGLGPTSPPYADVWASEDLGKSFVCTCASAPFGKRVSSGLAACPGRPQRLMLVGGGWNDDVDHWDCWISLDVGSSWSELQTPNNTAQRRQPAVAFFRLGMFVIFGGHNRRAPYEDAWVAKLRWLKKDAEWKRLGVRVGPDDEALEDLADNERPWFLTHCTAVDLLSGEFTGFAPRGLLALGRMPSCITLGRLPSEEESDVRVELSVPRLPAHCRAAPGPPDSAPDLHLLLASDARRLYVLTEAAIWATGGAAGAEHAGLRGQRRLLERIAQRLEEKHGLPSDLWHRLSVAIFGPEPSPPRPPQLPR
mmetsp:Transcript_42009/g.91716  ORF Transcript_42009/g.91716 Transcript_42009/m.91716 type:complete len:428 (+) Transcript_42009:117-1400(+)